MSLNSNGQYVPDLVHPPIPSSEIEGSGSPEGVQIGYIGQLYLDTDTDQLYFKKTDDGENTGWVLVTGAGGGGSQEVFGGTASPEGSQAAPLNSLFVDRSAVALYAKTGGGTGNTGWTQLIG